MSTAAATAHVHAGTRKGTRGRCAVSMRVRTRDANESKY